MIFDEKAMLQNTQKDEMQAPKNYYSDEYVVQVKLEPHNAKDDTHNAKRASKKYQQPYSISMGLHALSSHLPSMVLRIWFLMH